MLRRFFAIVLVCSTLSVPPLASAAETPPPTSASESAEWEAAQPDPDGVEPDAPQSMDSRYFKGYLRDTGKIVTSPLRWDSNDWLKAGAVLAVTTGLFFADHEIREFAQRNQSEVGDTLADIGNAIGDPLYNPAALGAFFLYGYLKEDRKAKRAALLAMESFFVSSLFAYSSKLLVHRHRPKTGDSPGTVDGPGLSIGDSAFYSGHTSNAFAIATVFASEYKDSRLIPPLAYSLATLTALARVYSDEHWASDVVFGAAMGYFTAKGVLSLHKKLDRKVTIAPLVSKKSGIGVTVGFKF